MLDYLSFIQIIISIALIICILLQQGEEAFGSAFGGSGGGEFYATRRGFQKKIFWFTIILAALFICVALLGLTL